MKDNNVWDEKYTVGIKNQLDTEGKRLKNLRILKNEENCGL